MTLLPILKGIILTGEHCSFLKCGSLKTQVPNGSPPPALSMKTLALRPGVRGDSGPIRADRMIRLYGAVTADWARPKICARSFCSEAKSCDHRSARFWRCNLNFGATTNFPALTKNVQYPAEWKNLGWVKDKLLLRSHHMSSPLHLSESHNKASHTSYHSAEYCTVQIA